MWIRRAPFIDGMPMALGRSVIEVPGKIQRAVNTSKKINPDIMPKARRKHGKKPVIKI